MKMTVDFCLSEHMESLQKQMAQQKDQLEDATSRITQLEAEKSSLMEDIARKEDEKARLEQSLTERLEATQSEMTVVQEELLTLKSASQQANEAQVRLYSMIVIKALSIGVPRFYILVTSLKMLQSDWLMKC